GLARAARRQKLLTRRWEETLAALQSGPGQRQPTGPTISILARDFLAYQRKFRRPRTAEVQGKTLRRFQDLMGDVPLTSIDGGMPADLVAALQKPLGNGSVNMELRHVRRALNWGARQKKPLLRAVPYVEMVSHTRPEVQPADTAEVLAQFQSLTI